MSAALCCLKLRAQQVGSGSIPPDLCTEFGLVGDCLLNFGPLVSPRSGSGRRLRILRSKLQCSAGCCRCKCLFFLGWSCIGFYAESQPESGVASTGKKPAGPFVIL